MAPPDQMMLYLINMRCKFCEYWHSENGECREIAGIAERTDRVWGTGAVVWAAPLHDIGIIAGLKTGPEFGCALFAAKPSTPPQERPTNETLHRPCPAPPAR